MFRLRLSFGVRSSLVAQMTWCFSVSRGLLRVISRGSTHPFHYCSRIFPALQSIQKMQSGTDTLEIGSQAPEFSLGAANRKGMFTFGSFLEKGPLLIEFLRGTW